MAQKVIDSAIQMFGGGGTSNDHLLTAAFATARLLRLADGPDEVHRNQIGKLEIKRYRKSDPALSGGFSDVLTLGEAERMASEGLWPKPKEFDA